MRKKVEAWISEDHQRTCGRKEKVIMWSASGRKKPWQTSITQEQEPHTWLEPCEVWWWLQEWTPGSLPAYIVFSQNWWCLAFIAGCGVRKKQICSVCLQRSSVSVQGVLSACCCWHHHLPSCLQSELVVVIHLRIQYQGVKWSVSSPGSNQRCAGCPPYLVWHALFFVFGNK